MKVQKILDPKTWQAQDARRELTKHIAWMGEAWVSHAVIGDLHPLAPPPKKGVCLFFYRRVPLIVSTSTFYSSHGSLMQFWSFSRNRELYIGLKKCQWKIVEIFGPWGKNTSDSTNVKKKNYIIRLPFQKLAQRNHSVAISVKVKPQPSHL